MAALAALVLAGGGSYRGAVAGALLLGLVIGGEFDVLVILIRRYVGLASFGRTYGLIFAVFQLGGAAGSAGLGLSVVWFGSYVPGLVLCGALLAIGAPPMPLIFDRRDLNLPVSLDALLSEPSVTRASIVQAPAPARIAEGGDSWAVIPHQSAGLP